MTSADCDRLIEFNYWARDRTIDAVSGLPLDQFNRELGSSFKSIAATLSHVYFAEWIWYERWNLRSPAGPPRGPFDDVPSLRGAWGPLEAAIRAFVRRLSDRDLEREISFRLLSGIEVAATFAEMIQHLVNHGSYHRGQVTTMLRQIGAQPPKSVDLITYFRETRGR
jgi:uncharacterized damage-inducible protein DinB